MPRSNYQPLSLDSQQHTSPTLASSNSRYGGPSPFYCSNCTDILSQWFPHLSSMFTLSRVKIIGYISGGLFALGWWIFIDAVSYASTRPADTLKVPIQFEHFVPGFLSTLALIIVNLINKETLTADDFNFSGSHVAAKATACAFIGVTMALSAMIGALCVLSLKYLIPGHQGPDLYLGVGMTVQNFLIFISSMILWFGRNSKSNDVYGF